MGIDLHNIKKKGMYNVPEGYFDKLPERIADSIKESEFSDDLEQKRSRKLWPTIFVAASIMGFIMVGYYFLNQFNANRFESVVSSNNALEYVDFYVEDFDESFIIDNILEINGSETGEEDSSDIIHYLIDEGIDEFTLYKEL